MFFWRTVEEKKKKKTWQSSSNEHDLFSGAYIYITVRKLFQSVLLWGLISCESCNCLFLLLFLSFECHLFKSMLNNSAVTTVSAKTLSQCFQPDVVKADDSQTSADVPEYICMKMPPWTHLKAGTAKHCVMKQLERELLWVFFFNNCCTLCFVANFPLFLWFFFLTTLNKSSIWAQLHSLIQWLQIAPLPS